MSIYPTELVAKSEFELRIFERVSQETGKQLLDEVKRLREALNQPAATPTLVGEQTLAPSIHKDNARVLQGILNEMREMLWAPAGASVVHVLRSHLRTAKAMHDALEYLSSIHPRRCHLQEVVRARDAIERYRALFQPSFQPDEKAQGDATPK